MIKNIIKKMLLFLFSINIAFQAVATQRYAGGGGPSGENNPSGSTVVFREISTKQRLRDLIRKKEALTLRQDMQSVLKGLSSSHRSKFISAVKTKYGNGNYFPSIQELGHPAAITKNSFLAQSATAQPNYFQPTKPLFFDPVEIQNLDQVVDGFVVIINTVKKMSEFVCTTLNLDCLKEKLPGFGFIERLLERI